MPGKYTQGYTKNAQKTKYVRHRDLKMKDGELKREQHIQKVMCEGICKRCREKVQWRFTYDKYKPLTKPATCQQCKNKTVTKAYRTICDGCAAKRNACPACCINFIEIAALEAQIKEATGDKVEIEGGENEMEVGEMDTESTPIVDATVQPEDAHDEQQQQEEEEGSEGEEEEEEDEADLDEEVVNDLNWHEKKFTNIAAKKYSKARKPGHESDVRY